MAYVRCKTIKGKTYRYLVKSVREGKRVRQVFVSYIGNPPPALGRAAHDAIAAGAGPGVEGGEGDAEGGGARRVGRAASRRHR